MLRYNKINALEGIDINKSNKSKQFDLPLLVFFKFKLYIWLICL